MSQQDVVIIGGGPAGISAALYTTRAGLKTLVVGGRGSALRKASSIENYYGFGDPVSGEQLLEEGARQAGRLGAALLTGEVTAVESTETGYRIRSDAGDFEAPAVLIATGQPPARPKTPGIAELEGHGVSYCTTCDGFFYKNKKVGVLGSGSYALQEALELTPFTQDISIFTNGAPLSFAGGYESLSGRFRVVTEAVLELRGEGRLREIALLSGAEPLDGLFVASGTASSLDFALKLGVMVRGNALEVDRHQKTNLPGVFAAGDCTGGFRQIATAVGQGALAGKGIIDYIRHAG